MDTKKLLLSLILLGISLALILVLSMKPINKSVQQPAYINKVTAPKGQLVSGFPKRLLMDANVTVSESFSIPYGKLGQYTNSFVSSKSISAEYNIYLNYLKANGFKLVTSQLKSTSANLYAVKSGADINLDITATGDKTNVLISYLTK
jgi:hypothetical protein